MKRVEYNRFCGMVAPWSKARFGQTVHGPTTTLFASPVPFNTDLWYTLRQKIERERQE